MDTIYTLLLTTRRVNGYRRTSSSHFGVCKKMGQYVKTILLLPRQFVKTNLTLSRQFTKTIKLCGYFYLAGSCLCWILSGYFWSLIVYTVFLVKISLMKIVLRASEMSSLNKTLIWWLDPTCQTQHRRCNKFVLSRIVELLSKTNCRRSVIIVASYVMGTPGT